VKVQVLLIDHIFTIFMLE